MSSKVVGSFGRTLAMFRVRRGISQSALAEACELDHSYISRLESGKRDPTRGTVNRIALELNLTEIEADALLGSAGFASDDRVRFVEESELTDILSILLDPEVGDPVKESIRRMCREIVRIADETR